MPTGKIFIRQVAAYAANYSKRTRTATQCIVIHATDGHEGPSKAEDVGAMIAGPLAKPRSPHAAVDSNSVVQCVPWQLTAYHCGHTGNSLTEGIEICGFAKQTRAEWLDALSLPTLAIAARLVAMRCAANSIGPVFVDRTLIRSGHRGITTHAEISHAWGESNHTDPGPAFPLAEFMEAVRAAVMSP